MKFKLIILFIYNEALCYKLLIIIYGYICFKQKIYNEKIILYLKETN